VPLTLVLSVALAAYFKASPVEPAPTETVIRLNVQAKAAPKPALRYLLLPELSEMTPGNPIEGYLRCFLDDDLTSQKEFVGRSALKQADRAARMDKPDWQILPKLKTDGVGLLIPDVQKLRFLANCLQERFRSELSQGLFDEALVTAKTMFAMSRHMGEHPTLIGDLVGFAIAQIAIGPLEEMLEQPGCPNLYWALTNLPSPFISLERGMEGERIFTMAELRDLSDTAPMTSAQLKKLVDHIEVLRDFEERPRKGKTQAWLDSRTKDPVHMVAAKKRLSEYGFPEERLQKFPADQIVLLDEKCEYEIRRDDIMKFMKLPAWQIEENVKEIPPGKHSDNLFGFFLPAMQKVRWSQGRLEQRFALLQHVEAIRLYAAAHKDQLPEKLADITVPLSVDPFTGKPFRYSVEGTTAHLRGSPPRGAESLSFFNIHYVITIKKP
jgi:hypothetical protein